MLLCIIISTNVNTTYNQGSMNYWSKVKYNNDFWNNYDYIISELFWICWPLL